MRKVLIWMLIVLVVAGGVGGAIWLNQRNAPQPIGEVLRTGEVVLGDLQLVTTASGNLAVNERTDLIIRVSGRVMEVNFPQNARVEDGDVLARMDTGDIERNVRQAEVALTQAEHALLMAETPTDEEDVRLAQIALNSAARALKVARLGKETARIDGDDMVDQAQRQREDTFTQLNDATDGAEQDRLRTAFEDAEAQERIAELNARLMNEQADSQLQAAVARYQQAERNLAQLQAEPDQGQRRQRELQVEQAQLWLDQAKRALEESTLAAPYGGVVAGVFIEPGTFQRAGARAFTLIDDTAFYVDVTIDEIDIGAIVVGQSADIVLDAYPETTLMGTVERIAPASTDLGGLVAYQVRLKVAPVDGVRMLDGMTASVSVRTQLIEDVLLIPNWAVRIDQGAAQAYAYAIVDGEPVRITIEIGRRNDTYSELLSGLSEGAEIALIAEERALLRDGGLFGN